MLTHLRREENTIYTSCRLCERNCGVDRTQGKTGYCGMKSEMRIARAALHMWEEPIISGTRGSGAVFFSGCSLGCIYCQNKEISHGAFGIDITEARLVEIMHELYNKGAHNINFVTPTHYAPSVARAIDAVKKEGVNIPMVYNTGGFDSAGTLDMLDGKIDIYLPDLKYYRRSLAKKYSSAETLPEVARNAIDIMVEQRGSAVIDPEGIMRSGVLVRLLLLPGALSDTKLNLKYLYSRYGDDIYISLMSQYTPSPSLPPPLNRRVTHAEYRELLDYAAELGVKNAFTQDISSADVGYTPPFDGEGV